MTQVSQGGPLLPPGADRKASWEGSGGGQCMLTAETISQGPGTVDGAKFGSGSLCPCEDNCRLLQGCNRKMPR